VSGAPPKSSSAPFQRSRELPIAFTLPLMAVYRLTREKREREREREKDGGGIRGELKEKEKRG